MKIIHSNPAQRKEPQNVTSNVGEIDKQNESIDKHMFNCFYLAFCSDTYILVNANS